VTRYLGYLRVSTNEQRLGLKSQRHAVSATVQALEGKTQVPVDWHEDIGVSGGKPWAKRPALADALLSIKKGDVLVVHRRDRLARDAVQAMLIDRLVARAGARIESADGARWDDTPESKLVRGILDLFSQYERELIQMRTSRALQAKKRRLEYTGGKVPYGMRIDQEAERGPDGKLIRPATLAVNGLEYACLKDFIIDPRNRGESFWEIRKRMMGSRFTKKFPPRYGKKWTLDKIVKIYKYHTAREAQERESNGSEQSNA